MVANSSADLEEMANRLWKMEMPLKVLGYGSNVLISDSGLRGVTIINRARSIVIDPKSEMPSVWAESGANWHHCPTGEFNRSGQLRIGKLPQRRDAGRSRLWNAGAFGGDMSSSLILAEILHPTGRELWPCRAHTVPIPVKRVKASVDPRRDPCGPDPIEP